MFSEDPSILLLQASFNACRHYISIPDHHKKCPYFADLMSTYYQQRIAQPVTTCLFSLPPQPKGVRPWNSEPSVRLLPWLCREPDAVDK